MKHFTFIKTIGLLILFSIISIACLWDNDTIEMETRQFPGTLELITGKFLRHSDEFHEWRIQDRLKRIKQLPESIKYYDDLAVSYSKLKRDKEAIEIMIEVEKMSPNRYETYANMGTFYIHDGDLKNGIKYIDKALEINSEAHFGREIYQKHLAEYLLTKQKDGKIELPLINNNEFLEPFRDSHKSNDEKNFKDFLLKKFNEKQVIDTVYQFLPAEELVNARKGIEGMMKFGNYDSPILLEILADILSNSMWEEAPRHFLALCYYNASINTNDSISAKKYLQKIEKVKHLMVVKNENWHTDSEKPFIKFNSVGEDYFQKIRQNEMAWIADSIKNPEVEFAKFYYGKDISIEELKPDTFSSSDKSDSSKKSVEADANAEKNAQWFMYGFLVLGAILVFWKLKNNK